VRWARGANSSCVCACNHLQHARHAYHLVEPVGPQKLQELLATVSERPA
jgi:hypothetical protein